MRRFRNIPPQPKESRWHNQYGEIFWLLRIIPNWPRLLSLWLYKSFYLGGTKSSVRKHLDFFPLCAQFCGEFLAIWKSQSERKEKDHWMVLKVKKCTWACQGKSWPIAGRKRVCSEMQMSFQCRVSPKEFQTLNNPISNSCSLKEELMKNRLCGGECGQSFHYPWTIPNSFQRLVYTSGISASPVDGPNTF